MFNLIFVGAVILFLAGVPPLVILGIIAFLIIAENA